MGQKHFGYYIIGLRNKGYGVSSTEEVLNQAFIILGDAPWLENHGEGTEVHGQNGLAQKPMPWRHHGERHAKRPP